MCIGTAKIAANNLASAAKMEPLYHAGFEVVILEPPGKAFMAGGQLIVKKYFRRLKLAQLKLARLHDAAG